MAIHIESNFICFTLQKEFIISQYDSQNNVWGSPQLIECCGDSVSSDISVQCCSFSPCAKYLAICLSKDLLIYSTKNWNCISSIKTERKSVCVRFFPKSDVILIAEKSGSVKFLKFSGEKIVTTELVLGHNSMLIESLITDDEQFIITCDRDKKIRVTNYPNVYNIQCYCLGHSQFVCSINFLQSDKRILVSSSGDGTIRLWEIKTGKELSRYENQFDENQCEKNKTCFFTKIISHKISDEQSLIVGLMYQSSQITILKTTGNIEKGVNICVHHIIKNSHSPWDIAFWGNNLVMLLSNKDEAVEIYNIENNSIQKSEKFEKISQNLMKYWDSLFKAFKMRSDIYPMLFQYKKDGDEANYTECKKIKFQ